MFKPSQRVVERVGAMLVEEDEEKIKVSLSSSQSSMDDIHRPSELVPTIEEHASVMCAYRVQVPPLPPYRPPKPMSEIPSSPVEVSTFILSLLPHTSVPALALLSRDFLSAAQGVWYGDLGTWDVRLWIFLDTRPPHLVILFTPSCPLIDASITISTLIYAGFRPMTTLESLLPSVRRLRFTFKSVGKRTEEKALRSAVVVCPAIEELEIEGECWCSIVLHFEYLRVLVIRTPGTVQVKATKEELDERFPLPKRARPHSTSSTISHLGHSMVVSERARAAYLANACPALQRLVFLNGVQWHRPSSSSPFSRSSSCLLFDDLFVKKIFCDIPPPPASQETRPFDGANVHERSAVL
ncbi:hypothetical protein EDD85DRAFT_976139 [Armillaria nabsnona]|nr:hypothetical protein EDD85DRAFT_976139 [Armillaria nabsnona]